MNFEITATDDFRRSLKKLSKRYSSLKQDLKNFADSIRENPMQGDELSPGIRKMRMAITSKGRGKSGGARVITYTVIVSENDGKVYLMDIYDKADYSTVDVHIIQKKIRELGLE
ncbi:MAG: addiction module toxin RelE [Muribaculaceae bacterium]|nr:addiction module toxin RelE [Muribaculaceae bacterium]